MKVWNAASGKLLGTLREHTDVVESVAWSPDGKRLASSSTDTAKVWDADSGRLLRTLQIKNTYAHAVSWSPDGKQLHAKGPFRLYFVWDADSGKRLPTGVKGNFVGHKMARTSNGKRLAKCDGHDVVVWGYVKQPANSLQAPERD